MAYYPTYNPNQEFLTKLLGWEETRGKNEMQRLKNKQEPERHRGEQDLNKVYQKLYGAQAEEIPRRMALDEQKHALQREINSPEQLAASLAQTQADAFWKNIQAQLAPKKHALAERNTGLAERGMNIRERMTTDEDLALKRAQQRQYAERYGLSPEARLKLDRKKAQEQRDEEIYKEKQRRHGINPDMPMEQQSPQPIQQPIPQQQVMPEPKPAMPFINTEATNNPFIKQLGNVVNKLVPPQQGNVPYSEQPKDIPNQTSSLKEEKRLEKWSEKPLEESDGKIKPKNLAEEAMKGKKIKSNKDLEKISNEAIESFQRDMNDYEMVLLKKKAPPGTLRRALSAALLKYTYAQIPVDALVKYTGYMGALRYAKDKQRAGFGLYDKDYSHYEIFRKGIQHWAASNARQFGGESVHVKNVEMLKQMIGDKSLNTSPEALREHIEKMGRLFQNEGIVERSAIHEPKFYEREPYQPEDIPKSIYESSEASGESRDEAIQEIMDNYGVGERAARAMYADRGGEE